MKLKKKRINSQKKVIKNQKYEEYWKSTLALTDFENDQFVRTLALIIEHIDKYQLSLKDSNTLIKNFDSVKKQFNQEVVHNKELENKIRAIFPNDSEDGSSTRKQINTFIKLGFVKPFLQGYVPAAKEYIKRGITPVERRRLFSDTVYQYSSFNSSSTEDDTQANQIKFLINTLLNRESKQIDFDELLGIMQMKIDGKNYAKEKEILTNKNWANHIDFFERKYNQIGHLKAVLSKMNLFSIINLNEKKKFILCLQKDVEQFLPERGDTQRDKYRYGLMRQAVLAESMSVYGDIISWFSKTPSEALVVSHIYASADALREWNIDEAYDPNNALLLKPGDEDNYFDKYKMTFASDGSPIFSSDVRVDFISYAKEKDCKLDKEILTNERINYLEKYHQNKFKIRNPN